MERAARMREDRHMPVARRPHATTATATAAGRAVTAVAAVLGALLLAACTPDGPSPPDDAPPARTSATGPSATGPSAAPTPSPAATAAPSPAIDPGTEGTVTVGERPVRLAVPSSYDPADPAPLVLLLHGFGSTADEVDAVLGLRAEAERRGLLYVLADGTPDDDGRRFWDATEACCNFFGPAVDDAGYLADVLRTVAAQYAVDPDGVVVAGHSNGGFMAYRMACEHADLVSAVVSLAGAMPASADACAPSRPVSVLQVHGTADSTIRYDGGSNGPFPYPSAQDSVDAWARLDGCGAEPATEARALDVEEAQPGAETSVTTYGGCRDGARVALWSVEGAEHVPDLAPGFAGAVLDAALGAG
jgi:polyhydroxybutyrate depolymerase